MWYVIILLLGLIYAIINIFLPGIFNSRIEAYFIRPLIWIGLSLVTILIARKDGVRLASIKSNRSWNFTKSPIQAGLLIGGFQVSLLIISGILLGFSQSPYMPTIQSYLLNAFLFMSMLIGLELSRTYLIKKLTHVHFNLTALLTLTAFLFMVLRVQIIDILVLDITKEAPFIQFFGETIIPLFAASLLATYLSYLGGVYASITYLGVLQLFHYYSPLLPNPSWIIISLINTIAPAFAFLIIQYSNEKPYTNGFFSNKKIRAEKDPTLIGISATIFCILLVFFSFGYLGVTPSIISSGSMRPTLDTGDIVILNDVSIETIQVGDIIQYEIQNVSTIHRVHDIIREPNSIVFITKGDANNAPDVESVNPYQITGKVTFTLPKIGIIPLVLRSLFMS